MPDLAQALQAMLPMAGVGSADPLTTPPGDLPRGAVRQRRSEFAAGRWAARHAMQMLGLPALDVPMGADRAPIWPLGLAGSISHTHGACLAAVVKAGVVGIDLEPENAVQPDIQTTVLDADERIMIGDNPALATVIFCAKEAVYKAQYPMTGLLFGFDRLHITLAPGSFDARFMAATGPIPAGSVWTGHFAHVAGYVLTAIHHP
jgi:4'-phosphopantetheinyl transferase EntD